jgi:hypothetical protein
MLLAVGAGVAAAVTLASAHCHSMGCPSWAQGRSAMVVGACRRTAMVGDKLLPIESNTGSVRMVAVAEVLHSVARPALAQRAHRAAALLGARSCAGRAERCAQHHGGHRAMRWVLSCTAQRAAWRAPHLRSVRTGRLHW